MELHAQIACAMPRELAGKALGWQARAVYLEAVLYCRENLRDGKILRAELMFWMPDMPVNTRVKYLTELSGKGALRPTADDWQVPEKVWRKWGKMRADVEAEREMASELGVEGNHKRWHIGPDGKPSPKCPLCRRDHIGSPDRQTVGPPDRVPIGSRSPKPKPDPDPDPETHPKPDPEPPSSSSQTTHAGGAPGADDDGMFVNDLMTKIARTRTDARVRNPGAHSDYLAKVILDIRRNEMDAIRAFVADRPHLRDASIELAAQVYDAVRNAS